MNYKRYLYKKLTASLNSGKTILLVGVQKVGNTILLKEVKNSTERINLLLNGEDPVTLTLLVNNSVHQYKQKLRCLS